MFLHFLFLLAVLNSILAIWPQCSWIGSAVDAIYLHIVFAFAGQMFIVFRLLTSRAHFSG